MTLFTLNVLLCIVHIHALENLALYQPTWEEYPWPDKMRDFGSDNAVDGMYTDRGVKGQCTISDDGKYNATWGVDLGRVVSISHIDIYYRKDYQDTFPYIGRFAGFFVYVSNTTTKDDGYLCYHDTSTERNMLSVDQHINCTVLGRYVIYYNERRQDVQYPSFYSQYAYNELCEVEVYGCNGTYGHDCIYPCPTHCQDGKCDTNSGHCLSCVPGYKGPICNQVCNTNTYGQACVLKCGNCSNGEACHHINGACIHGCAEGTIGDACQEGCQSGYYGRNCSQRCSENCIVTDQCDRFTGQCYGGCKPRWTGNTCNQTKFSRMSREKMPEPTNKTEDKDHQYTELEEVDKCKTYEEIHSYSNRNHQKPNTLGESFTCATSNIPLP